MSEILLLLTGAILVNNFVLTQFLGICPFIGVGSRLEAALAMAAATTFVMTLSAIATWLLHRYLLQPFDLLFLRTLSYMLVIATVATLTAIALQRIDATLYRLLGIFVPLLTTNCAVLGVALLNEQQAAGFVEAVFHGFGAAAGFSLVLLLFAALHERLLPAAIPQAFRGAPIALVTAGLMSLAFMGFAGLV